jgi:hypothetical protein
VSFSAQPNKNLSDRASSGRQNPRRKLKARHDFRRAFLEQLEGRQLMATLPFGTDDSAIDPKVPPGTPVDNSLLIWDGSKVSPSDPRVVAWPNHDFVTDSFIVGFQKTVTREEAEQTLATEIPGSSIKTWDDELHYAAVDLPAGMTRDDVIALGHHFLSLSNTLYAEPDFVRVPDRMPNDPLFDRQWSLNNTTQGYWDTARYPVWYDPPNFDFPPTGISDADIDAVEAWDLTTGSPDVIVAVLDTGMNLFDTIMRPNFWVNPGEIFGNGKDDDANGVIDDIHGYDAAEDDGDPQDMAQDGHGISVSSIVAAPGNEGIDMTGVSWNSKIMTIKVADDAAASFTTTGIIGGYRYVTRMKQVYHQNIVAANMSFGGYAFSFIEYDALSAMNNANIVMTMSAGNAGTNNDIVPHYPSDYDISNIICVTGSDSFDEVANNLGFPYLNYGPNFVDIAAPGIDIMMQAFPSVVTQPFYVFPGPPLPNTPAFTQVYRTTVNTGTSMAAPHVAGVAALAASLAPYLTAQEIKQAILSSVDKFSQMQPLIKTGGRLNAFNTLNAIPKTTISGTVFQDANNDKVQGVGELGLGGWQVYLDLDNDSVFDTGEPGGLSVTAAQPNGPAVGSYSFDAWVDTGTYRVRQVVQPGFTQTTPTGNNGAFVINVSTRGQDFANRNFGNRMSPGTIVGRKFLDLDADGSLDTNESGQAGILFYVDVNNNGRINVGEPGAYTDAQGNFTIPNIQPGTYAVREVLSPGFIPTLPPTLGANGLPDPVLNVTVVSNATNTPPLLFGNRIARDWGDLPETTGYDTRGVSGGPSHGILPGFMLGTRQDFEADGLPNATARGDDNNPTGALSDEDGLVSINLVQGSQGTLTIRTTNSGRAPGYIQGWIDFDNDGSFLQPGDQILRNRQALEGNNTFTFPIPAGVDPGVVFMRLRYAYERDLGPSNTSSPNGFDARAGEVEDYQVTLFSAGPIANPDFFPDQSWNPTNPNFIDPLIKQGSTNNELDVLRNDPAPATGTLSIVPASVPAFSQQGGTLTIATVGGRQVILYTPKATPQPFTGDDEFTYQVTNGTLTSAPARVRIRVTAKDPIAVDNTFTFVGNTVGSPAVSHTMNVLANDVNVPTAPISLLNFTQPTYPPGTTVTGPTVTRNGNDLVITPPDGFTGTVQFQYTITDTDMSTVDATAFVTVQVTAATGAIDPDYLAMLSVEVRDARGNLTTDPGFRIDVNETFFVFVFSEDLRQGGGPDNRGVEAAYLDLLYNRGLAAVNFVETSPGDFDEDVNFAPDFANDPDPDPALGQPPGPNPDPDFNFVANFDYFPRYDFDRNSAGYNSPEGIYNELGAAHNGNDDSPPGPMGKGKKLVMVVGLDAIAAGSLRIIPDPAEDASNRSQIGLAPEPGSPNFPQPVPAPDTLVYLQESPVFQIGGPGGAPEFVNERDALDVNADSRISAFDALAVVNELNLNGARGLREYDMALGGGLPPAGYVDTNGDGSVTAFDALGIINYLNLNPTSGAGPTGGAPEFTGSAPEFTGGGNSAGEAVEPVLGGEEESVENGGTAPLLLSTSTNSNVGPTEQNSQSSGPSQTQTNDAELLYLTAVDQLMSQSGDEDAEEATTSETGERLDIQLQNYRNRLRSGRSRLTSRYR